MRVINFFGAPGAGKSTAASGLFHEMKKHWMSAEYVQEYAKELVWSDSAHMLSEQNCIFAEQEHRLNRLRRKVDLAVADAPLLHSSFFAPGSYPSSFHQLVFDFFHSYQNINIFVRRAHEYARDGRIQTVKDSDAIAGLMETFLQDNGVPYWSMTATNASPSRLLSWLIRDFGIHPPPDVSWSPVELPANWLQYHPPKRLWQPGSTIIPADLSDVLTVG